MHDQSATPGWFQLGASVGPADLPTPDPATTLPAPAATATLFPAVPGYVVESVLGRGGMGVVYKARQDGLDRPVALKMLRAADAPPLDLVMRFRLEAEAAAHIKHPHVVQVYEVGWLGEQPYLALEFLDGGTLAERLQAGPLEPRGAARLVADLADAVQAAHGLGIIHRDLKPANVLFDRAGTAKVADFGLARRLDGDARLTQSGQIVGTPAYMAPEQAEGRKDVGTAADVYALGAILYECLTGRPVITAGSSLEALLLVRTVGPEPPSRLRPGLARDLEVICLKCLEKEPGRRYPTAQALAEDLGRFLAGEAIAARPLGAAERAWRWCRRHPAWAGLAAAVLLGLAGTSAALAWALDERAAAEEAAGREREAAGREREAADRERQAAAEAVRQAAFARDVSTFLQTDLLGLAGVRAQLEGRLEGSHDLKVRHLLDRAAQGLDAGHRFAGQPLTEAAIRLTLGRAYLDGGEIRGAAAQLERAAALRLGQLGPDHPDTLEAQYHLAIAWRAAGDHARARDLFAALRPRLAAAYGPDHDLSLSCLVDLAQEDQAAGHADQGKALLTEALRRAEAALGPDHATTLIAAMNLARLHLSDGQPAQALALIEANLPRLRAVFGADHPDTLGAMNNLGACYKETGQVARAAAVWEETYRLLKARQGEDHPAVLTLLNNLGLAYRATGRPDKGLTILEETFRLKKARLGPDHPDTLTTQTNLATAYRDQGRLAEATPLLEEALRRAPPPLVRPITQNLLIAYAWGGDRAKLVPLVRTHLTACKARHPAGSLPLVGEMVISATLLNRAGAHAEAEGILRECLPAAEALATGARPAMAGWQLANTRSQLGEALLGQGKLAEAEPLLVQAWEALRAAESSAGPGLRRFALPALARVVRLYEAQGVTAAAEPYRAELGRRLAAELDRDSAWPLLWGRPVR